MAVHRVDSKEGSGEGREGGDAFIESLIDGGKEPPPSLLPDAKITSPSRDLSFSPLELPTAGVVEREGMERGARG